MTQIWWCVQILHLIILFFDHFSKWSVVVSIHVRASISMWFDVVRSMVRTTSAAWHPLFQMALGCEVYAVCSCTSFAMHCAAHIPVWCWWGILFITCFHYSCLMWRGIIYVMYLLSWFVMLCFGIPLLYVDGILILSSCMFALRSLLCHVGGIHIMHEFVSYW